MRRRSFGLALLVAASTAGCRGEGVAPPSDLEATFASHAREVTAVGTRRAFVASGEGFASVAGGRIAARVDAGRVEIDVDGARIGVVEEGLAGAPSREGEAIVLPREDGASYWSARAEGFEEWLALRPGVAVKGRVVARYRIDGAILRQRGGDVDVLGPRGRAVVTVRAPEGFTASGRSIRPRIVAREREIELYADANGEAALVDPTWTTPAMMNSARAEHTVDMLLDGRVIACGGSSASGLVGDCEIFDPNAGTWTPTAPMNVARTEHTATLLPNGHLVLSGGSGVTGAVASIEEYDPSMDTWTVRGNMQYGPVRLHTATLLNDGRILFTGGIDDISGSTFAAGTIDTTTWQWGDVPPMSIDREEHTATLLPSGDVAVLGGGRESFDLQTPGSGSSHPEKPAPQPNALSTIEIFSATLNHFTLQGALATPRKGHSTLFLPDGRLFVVGGWDEGAGYFPLFGELIETANFTSTPTATMLQGGHYTNVAAFLPDGTVLVTGDGIADIFDPGNDTISPALAPPNGYDNPRGASIATGVVVCGGTAGQGMPAVADAEVYVAQLANGLACMNGSDCMSGACADGVCCDKACDADGCSVCTKAKGATADGTCTALADGGSCNDGQACTTDACQAGVCVGTPSCVAPACEQSLGCDVSGACAFVAIADGAPCEGGTCFAGACVGDPDAGPLTGSSTASGASAVATGGPSSAGAGGANGSGGGAAATSGDSSSGGGCSVSPGEKSESFEGFALLGLALAAASGRKRRARL